MPEFKSEFAAGMDLYVNESKTLGPGQHELFSTGFQMSIPHGYAGLIWDRSGMAVKHGIKTKAGVIDSDYRGELKIALMNLSTTPITIEKHTRVAQMLIQKVENLPVLEVEELEDTQRGDGGFGSSGSK